MITCNRYGSRIKRVHSKTFFAGITINMLFQLWTYWRKWLPFTTRKISIWWSLVAFRHTRPTFVYWNLQRQKSVFIQWKTKTFWKKFENMLLVVHLSLLHAKQLSMKLFYEFLQTYGNQLLELMPAKCILAWCVHPCPPVFIRVGISIQKPVDSHLDKTRPVSLKIWSCTIFNEQDLIVKLRDSTLETDRKKLTASLLMGFVLIEYCVRSNWLLLSLLSVSRDAPISHWRSYQRCDKEKRARWFETKLHTGIKRHYFGNMVVWVIETVPDKY